MPEIDYSRITVGDQHVCPSCVRLENEPAKTMAEWDASGLKPRVAPTECNGKCRCVLVPDSISAVQAEAERLVDEAVDRAFGSGIHIDLTTGRRVLLKDFEQIEGMLTTQYTRIAYMEDLIYKWKVATEGKKLPTEFFKIANVNGMIKWLEGNLKNG
jgi:hypothetical protein